MADVSELNRLSSMCRQDWPAPIKPSTFSNQALPWALRRSQPCHRDLRPGRWCSDVASVHPRQRGARVPRFVGCGQSRQIRHLRGQCHV